ncbi:hypothetical protein MP228_013091 [Amoeboaphelidium protococcarum]|nr:hypothetical protein MP228_013091 [Amoeboaphelidium protococcarum]
MKFIMLKFQLLMVLVVFLNRVCCSPSLFRYMSVLLDSERELPLVKIKHATDTFILDEDFAQDPCLKWPVGERLKFDFVLRLYLQGNVDPSLILDEVVLIDQHDFNFMKAKEMYFQWSNKGMTESKVIERLPQFHELVKKINLLQSEASYIENRLEIQFTSSLQLPADTNKQTSYHLVLFFKPASTGSSETLTQSNDALTGSDARLSVLVGDTGFAVCPCGQWARRLSHHSKFKHYRQKQENVARQQKIDSQPYHVRHDDIMNLPSGIDPDQDCVICHDALLNGKGVMIPRCHNRHATHPECLKQWYTIEQKCPTCRSSIWIKK